MYISDSVKYVGVNDRDIELFEGQYVVENGMAYNSYLIMDEKTALMDTVDIRGIEEWSRLLEETLDGRKLDYIVVQHMEPDHSGSLQYAIETYPDAIVVSVASHQMEKNLDQNGQDHQSQEQDKTTGSIRRIRRSNINLNLYNSDEEALEEASGLDDAARIAMEMMTANGNTMDLLA